MLRKIVEITWILNIYHFFRMATNPYTIAKRIKVKYIFLTVLVVGVLDFFGVFTHVFEKDFYSEFHYPQEGDIRENIMQLRAKESPSVPPINVYNYSFISNSEQKCKEGDRIHRLQLVYIVKSAVENFNKRKAIRNTWGFENRFSDVPLRTVFLLGVHPDREELQTEVDIEQMKYRDIVQANFVDSYFNNTLKTMMGFKWAVKFCPRSKFYMFSDDDMYISTKNVLRFIRNPTHYPHYLEDPVVSLKRNGRKKRSSGMQYNRSSSWDFSTTRKLKQFLDFELADDVKLFAGYVFRSAPHRHRSSKWYVPLTEYPYHMWPPYVTAGAYVLSHEALHDMYYASHYTKHFRFDDIYLGLVAMKADIEPYHCDEFHYYKKEYNVFSYRYVVASHGYSNPGELLHVWNEQKSAGNA